MSWHHPWPTLAGPEEGDVVVLTPEQAGWTYCGLRVLSLSPGQARVVQTGGSELFVLPLSGGGVTVEVAAMARSSSQAESTAEASFDLAGRSSVFSRVTDFAYVGRDSEIRLTSEDGAEVALPSARCERRRPARYGAAEDVPVEVRGAGQASRQVTNFGVPGAWDHAEKLACVELITPGGNWSSYPPHKHDPSVPCEVANEEIYFFRIAGRDGVTPGRGGFGVHRTYTGPEHHEAGLEKVDETVEVRDSDVYVIPHGYHGPCMAAPDYPMYYLNVLAGPGDQRSLAFCDDPAHAWVREGFETTPVDPRCPVTSAAGRTDTSRIDTAEADKRSSR